MSTPKPTYAEIEELTDSYGQLHEDDCELVTLEDGSYDGCSCDMKHLTQAIQRLIQEAELRGRINQLHGVFAYASLSDEVGEVEDYINARIAELQAQLQQLQKEENGQAKP